MIRRTIINLTHLWNMLLAVHFIGSVFFCSALMLNYINENGKCKDIMPMNRISKAKMCVVQQDNNTWYTSQFTKLWHTNSKVSNIIQRKGCGMTWAKPLMWGNHVLEMCSVHLNGLKFFQESLQDWSRGNWSEIISCRNITVTQDTYFLPLITRFKRVFVAVLFNFTLLFLFYL